MRNQRKYDDLYILKNPFTKRYKIGRTTNFNKRLRNIITSGGVPEIEAVSHVIMCGDFESYLLKIFHNYNVVGEWFYESKIFSLFITSVKEFENNRIPFEELIIRFSILENEFPESVKLLKMNKFSDIVIVTNPLYKSAQTIFKAIEKERKGIGWGVQSSFLDFIFFRKIEFRNFIYSINSLNKSNYNLVKSSKFDINNPKLHIKIELLKMKKNNTNKWKQKDKIQDEIDKLFYQY